MSGVEDDGAGFDIATQKKGSGLQHMEDRLDALGGQLELRSSPGQGTTLLASLPNRPDAEQHARSAAIAVGA